VAPLCPTSGYLRHLGGSRELEKKEPEDTKQRKRESRIKAGRRLWALKSAAFDARGANVDQEGVRGDGGRVR
jgi:hypothetical protein